MCVFVKLPSRGAVFDLGELMWVTLDELCLRVCLNEVKVWPGRLGADRGHPSGVTVPA